MEIVLGKEDSMESFECIHFVPYCVSVKCSQNNLLIVVGHMPRYF